MAIEVNSFRGIIGTGDGEPRVIHCRGYNFTWNVRGCLGK